jgi:hypothetical protein
MAEEEKKSEKKSKGQSRYGNPPKIKDKPKTEPAKAEASKEKPGDAPVEKTEPEKDNPGSAPKADVMAGTDGVDVQTRHASERDEMSKRHAKEVHQMHSRHADEHAAMIEKHKNDAGTIGGFPGDGGAGGAGMAAGGAAA